MSKKEIRFREQLKLREVIAYLEELASSMRLGKITVEHGDSGITLVPGNDLNFDLSLSSKKEKDKLAMELSWSKFEEDKVVVPLRISANDLPEMPKASASKAISKAIDKAKEKTEEKAKTKKKKKTK